MKKLRTGFMRGTLVVTMVAIWSAAGVSQADAQEEEVEVEELASLERGPIVRRQLLHRSARLEVQPMMAFTVNDAFIRNGLPGLSATYFLNNSFGILAGFNYGLLQLDTSLRRNIADTVSAERLDDLSYSKFNWTLDAGLVYVPAFGKFSVMNSLFTHYDFHLMGGVALLSEGAVAAVDGGLIDEGLNSMRPSLMLGGGLRFFLNDMFSLNFQIRNYVTTRAEVSAGSASPQLGNTVILSGGVGIFLPGEVKIAR